MQPGGRDALPIHRVERGNDLNTPLADAQNEVARAPQGQLAIIPGSGHITQDHANGPGGRIAVRQFLTGL